MLACLQLYVQQWRQRGAQSLAAVASSYSEQRQGSIEEWKRKRSGRGYEERKHLISKIPDLPHIIKISSPFFRYISKNTNQNKQKRPTATITELLELKPESSIFQTCLLARIGYTLWGTMREINRLLIKPGFPDG